MPTLISLKPHPYESRSRAPGVEYEATDHDARLLVLSGQARYKDEAEERSQSYDTRVLTPSTRAIRRRTK